MHKVMSQNSTGENKRGCKSQENKARKAVSNAEIAEVELTE